MTPPPHRQLRNFSTFPSSRFKTPPPHSRLRKSGSGSVTEPGVSIHLESLIVKDWIANPVRFSCCLIKSEWPYLQSHSVVLVRSGVQSLSLLSPRPHYIKQGWEKFN